VPQVVGMPRDQAAAEIRAAGLTLGEVTEDPEAEAEAGTVVASRPAARAEVDCDSGVDLVVAVTAPCTVPQVVGLTEQEARTAISDARLTMGDVGTEASSSVAEGEVLRSTPAAGATPECGSTVTIVVSSGPDTCTVPQVVGKTPDEAVTLIQKAGLRVSEGDAEASSTVTEGNIARSDPAAGEQPECNSTVTIFMSSGPNSVG
jgi:beta-lactam-binding protein with PASTA domain